VNDWNEEPSPEDFRPEDFEALLDLADKIGDLPLGPRHAEMILQHRRFRKLGRLFAEFHRGFKDEHIELMKLVARLHDCYRETEPGFWVVKVGHADARAARHRELAEYIAKLAVDDGTQATH
jgi:hypothetical protein